MSSWVLSTFLILTCYMLLHAGVVYFYREYKNNKQGV